MRQAFLCLFISACKVVLKILPGLGDILDIHYERYRSGADCGDELDGDVIDMFQQCNTDEARKRKFSKMWEIEDICSGLHVGHTGTRISMRLNRKEYQNPKNGLKQTYIEVCDVRCLKDKTGSFLPFYSRYCTQGFIHSWAYYQTTIEELIETPVKRPYMKDEFQEKGHAEEIEYIEMIMENTLFTFDLQNDGTMLRSFNEKVPIINTFEDEIHSATPNFTSLMGGPDVKEEVEILP